MLKKGFKDKLGERLKDRRIKCGYTSGAKLAAQIGSTAQTISNYETGKFLPDAETLYKLAEVLNCTVDYLSLKEPLPTHEAASIAEQTGLSSDTVQILIDNYKDAQQINGLKALSADYIIEFMNRLINYPYLPLVAYSFCKWAKECANNAPFSEIMSEIMANIEHKMGTHPIGEDQGAPLLQSDRQLAQRYAFIQQIDAFLSDTEKRIVENTEQAHFADDQESGGDQNETER